MILQDLAGIFLSSLSFFARDVFRLVWKNYQKLHTYTENEDPPGTTRSVLSVTYEQFPNYKTNVMASQNAPARPRFCKTFLNSLWTSITMLLAALPLGLFAAVLLFVDLNTANLCSELIHNNRSLQAETSVFRLKLIGDISEDLGLFCWFPSTMIFLFGWKEFKANYLIILFCCFSCACVGIIYKLILFLFNPYAANEYYYHLAGNVFFFTSILWSSYLIAVKIRKNRDFTVPPPKTLIMAAISAQFIFAFIIGLAGTYFIIPTFTRLDSQFMKAVFAAITPVVTVVPVAICRQFALLSNVFTNSKNQFILAYFVYGATVIVYRVMQADVDIELFIALSVLHGFVNVVGKATERRRYKLWARMFRALKSLKCCRLMELQAYHQRLNADKEIQRMLYDYAAMILSQMYLILYSITNFDDSYWERLYDYLYRIAIGLGIDMFFNIFSILVNVYMYNNPLQIIWKEHWRVHMMANAVTTAMTVWYFSTTLLIVVHSRVNHENIDYLIKNCTAPMKY